MRKGQPTYNNCALYFVPEVISEYEEFRPITEQVVPGILNYYMISNFGRIWHKYKQKFLAYNYDSKGYLYKPLATINGTKNYRVHRLVLMTFNYIPGCEDLIANHKDGNKANPCLWNLEWTTFNENMAHAKRTGLLDMESKISTMPPRKKPEFTVTEQQVEEICKLLQDGDLTQQQISKQTGVSYHVIQAIQGKRTWRNISDKYDIKPRKVASNLTEEQVHLICKYFEDVKRPEEVSIRQYCRDALSSIGLSEHTHLQLRSVLKILARETYSYISKDYNF